MPDPRVNVIVGAATAAAQRSLGLLTTAVGNMIARWQDYALMAARAINRQIAASIDFADTINKLAQKTGIAHRELSALAYVAELADVSIAELELSVRQLNQWLERTGQASRSTLDVLLETADIFADMPDGPQKTAIAMERFGRAGTQMIPLLNQGQAAIREMVAEAERFGLIIDERAAQAAERFNDNLRRLQYAGRGLSNQVAQALLPTLNEASEVVLDLAANGQRLEVVFDGIRNTAALGLKVFEGWTIAVSGLSSLMRGEGFDAGAWEQARAIFDAQNRAAEEVQRRSAASEARQEFDLQTEALKLQLDRLRFAAQNLVAGGALLDNLREQLAVYRELSLQAAAAAGGEPDGTARSIELARERLKISQDMLEVQRQLRAVEESPLLGAQLTSQWSAMILQLGTDAQIAAAGITRAFEGAWMSVSTGLVNIIDQTGTWTDLLRSVRRVILQEVMNAIVQMFMRWIAMETLKAMVSIGLAKKETLAKAGPALMESIKSYGLAALLGGAAFVAITAAMGGFRRGGYTGDGGEEDVAGLVHAGEYVIPAPRVRDIGLPTLEAIRSGREVAVNPRAYARPAAPTAGASGSSSPTKVNVVLVDSRRAAERWMEEHGEARIVDVLDRL